MNDYYADLGVDRSATPDVTVSMDSWDGYVASRDRVVSAWTAAGVRNPVVLTGDSGVKGYYGANPPAGHGPHRYLYAVHAVDTELPADEIANPTQLGFNLNFHSLGRAIIWGWYENQ